MPNCLVGCIRRYNCGFIQNSLEGHNIAPMVKVFFESPDEPTLTVGNKSAPFSDNHAVIKSFEFSFGGQGKGVKASIEVADEQGGNFVKFVERMNKCVGLASNEYRMKTRWGWTITNCDGSTSIIESPTVTLLPMDITVDFSSGVVKFLIEAHDMMSLALSTHHDEVEGDDDQKLPLKQAIRQLGNNKEPKMSVRFLRINPDGTESEWNFKDFGPEGPEATWEADSQHKLAAIMKWIEPYRTDRDKGIIPMWDTTASSPTLLLLEDPLPKCNEGTSCKKNIGTYIVNGGSCSPVIKFSPKISYKGAFQQMPNASGNSGGAASGETVEKDKSECERQTRETGFTQSIAVSRQAWDTLGPARATGYTEDSQNLHNRANSKQVAKATPINAELQIQGDPREAYVNAKTLVGNNFSIVVINPFHLFGQGNGGCGDWLALPGCNPVLSNKAWLITGVNHSIKEGSYTTTFQLILGTPGGDLSPGVPFGGPGSAGWTPPNTC